MDKYITLDYGSGGLKTSELIEEMIVPALDSEVLSELTDGAVLDGPSAYSSDGTDSSGPALDGSGRLVFSTDSFVIDPYFFPGGDIGKLSVCGTVNDISVSGGIPKYLSLGIILEEGFPTEDLRKIISSIKAAADMAGVKIVTGDTKVVEKGKGDGIYINTSGIGFLACPGLSPKKISDGDAVIISGNAGDHGISVMLARNTEFLKSALKSDCAPVNKLASALFSLGPDLKVMRDPTRGGVATTLCEFVEGSRFAIELDEQNIPIAPGTETACDILGLDPLYCACEGRLLAVVSPDRAAKTVELLRSLPGGENAAVIGKVVDTALSPAASSARAGKVLVKTGLGGTRIMTKLAGDQLPRIC